VPLHLRVCNAEAARRIGNRSDIHAVARTAETTATSVAERRDHMPGRHNEHAIPDRQSRVGV